MPFTWKKKTRFSQLVADHLQSPKHGGSLVVETGFPTSLIDLYVRNRGRFRRSSAKKSRANDSSNSVSSSWTSDSSLGLSNLSSVDSDCKVVTHEIVEEDVVVEAIVSSDCKIEEETSVEMTKSNRVLLFALKVLFVLVLALGTKRFTVGITISALVLFFLELVGKPLFGRSSLVNPGVNSNTVFESSFHGAKNFESSKGNRTQVVCNEVLEIEEVIEVRSDKELDEVSTEVRDKSSRRAKMKLKMKKLVPKKLRTSRSSMDSKDEILNGFKEEDAVEPKQDLKPLLLKQEQEKIIEIEGQSSSSMVLTQVDTNEKLKLGMGMELQQNSGYLVLCLIVLIGLVGGRILALVLALSWCFILKMAQRRNVKFPIS